MITLNTPVENLTKVGKTVAGRLAKLGLVNVADLIYHFPFRYDDFSQVKAIDSLKPGELATVKGKIELLANRRSFRKKMIITECLITDASGSAKAIWFRQPFIVKILKNGDEVYFAGKTEGDLFTIVFHNPSYEKISAETTHTARLVPIYPLTENLTQKQLRFLIRQALNNLPKINDWLPEKIKNRHGLIDLSSALAQVHFPDSLKDLALARKRLKFDELLKLQLQNLSLKDELAQNQAQPIKFHREKTKEIVNRLPFKLTQSQRQSAWEILQNLEQTRPMNRLLEGDVGSGKTVVAALAAANAALNKIQTAFLVPTEILAQQHFYSFKELLQTMDINIALLSRSQHAVYNTKDKEISSLSKAQLLKTFASGETQIIIGSHALLNEQILYNNLGLIIIDEQHRFGVKQRQALKSKSGQGALLPHFLSMTATPIPRTLALTLAGDLDLSIINELPPDRKKPLTKLVAGGKRNQAYEFILAKIKEGRQAFVICPIIEETDALGIKSATEEYDRLTTEIFPQLSIGLLHGRLKNAQKAKVMADFSGGLINILVATSVVEVGVNVPNASVMIIESAERFGLASLHQFRGRVNRSAHQAYCLLFTNNPSEKSFKRLQALIDCFDGFKLAEEDLKQRGFGNLFGLKQSGFGSGLKLADLSDLKLIQETKKAAEDIFNGWPKILDKMNLTNNVHLE